MKMLEGHDTFAGRLIGWQRRHGRHNLPWQGTRDPYRVWLSEIMLQQTQVSTVIGYYGRFLQTFPTVLALANASQDAVLALWSGLGYYSRARNLHRCAQIVRDEYGGVFPASLQELERLPGIGPSTAAAIAAFCLGTRVSIFDANVQRVMARFLASPEDLSRSPHKRMLWQRAEEHLPAQEPADSLPQRMAIYTQALMDVGATICTPRQPVCGACPVAALCRAHAQGNVSAYPQKTGKLRRTAESWWLLVLARQPSDDGKPAAIWLQKRAQTGVWGGLHCVPVFSDEAALKQVLAALPVMEAARFHSAVKHVLTHKDLYLHPVSAVLPADAAVQALPGAWYEQWQEQGLPAPVRKWLNACAPSLF